MTRFQRWRRWIGWTTLVTGLLVVLALAAPALHLIDTKALRTFASPRSHPPFAAVYFSGDMGLRFGMGPKVAPVLAAHGLPVIGVSSSVNFATHRTREQADAILAGAIRTAMRQTGADKVVLIGQSFGSDMVATTMPDLPPELRSHVAGVILVVPAQTVFLRSDPTGLTYLGTPDAHPEAGMRTVTWAPVVCIYGLEEKDSLCPRLADTSARIVGLPGGHFLHHDDKLLAATIMDALRRIDPTILN